MEFSGCEYGILPMTIQAPSSHAPDSTALVTRVATSPDGKERPPVPEVVEALLEMERTTRHHHTTFPFEALLGQWQLRFTTGTRKARQGGIVLGKGFYMPGFAPAFISFTSDDPQLKAAEQGRIGNQIQVGPLWLKFAGPCRYIAKKNLLAFDFTEIQVKLFGQTVYQGDIRGGKAKNQQFETQRIAKLPFFAFFDVTDRYIAARGRGGGLAVWIRADD